MTTYPPIINFQINSESEDKISFEEFLEVAGHFLRDDDVLEKELKEAFRLYDKEGK